jgi:uncharacterized RDD family membrane protein YckC
MRSAELHSEAFDFPGEGLEQGGQQDSRSELQRQVAERLAAHRSRRSRQSGPALVPATQPVPKAKPAQKQSIAAAVAERYAQSQSYRDFLAAEAERAIAEARHAAEEAQATAQVAERSAQAIVAAQQQLLVELESWDERPTEKFSRAELSQMDAATLSASENTPMGPPTITVSPEEVTIRPFQEIAVRRTESGSLHRSDRVDPLSNQSDPDETSALDEEIEFRQAPVFAEPSGPPVPIPANLIEFPRQLVAPRKARPRIAEGPLLDEAEAAAATVQLRIFEVEPAQIATGQVPDLEASAPPVWSSILLDAPPVPEVAVPELAKSLPPLQVAPLNLRLMAGIVDLCAVATAFLAAATGFTLSVSVLPDALPAAVSAVATFTVLFVLYHLLFFTFSDSTPGMRYARIGLCTFDDENPTRAAMRYRTLAVLLAALPLGLGFLAAWFDGERLGWHDRLSRMYQRHY